MRNLIFSFIFLSVFLVGGCTVEPPARIPVEIPQKKTIVVVPKGAPKSFGKNRNQQVYPDPCRGIIDNLSQEIVKVWFDRKIDKPNLVLQPGMVSGDIYLPMGFHRIYIERWSWTRYGLKFREATIVLIKVGQFFPYHGENYGWEIQIRNNWVTTPEGNFYFY